MIRVWTGVLLAALLLAAPARAAGDCAAPAPVCAVRAAVFPVVAFDPMASAVRIGPGLLVTNRHVVADFVRAEVLLPDGRRIAAEVVPTDYPGDLVLLRAPDLPEGPVPEAAPAAADAVLYVVGVDTAARAPRVFAPGRVLLLPAPGRPRARLYNTAAARPGTSGGALVDAAGRLVGIVTSGGEGRNEAIPAARLADLMARSGPAYAEAGARRGRRIRDCMELLDATRGAPLGESAAATLSEVCTAAGNRQLLDLVGQRLSLNGRHAEAAAIFEANLAGDPNALNTRYSLAVALHLAGRYAEATPHLARLIEVLPEAVPILRLAVQAGKWGGDRALAERAVALIAAVDPRGAERARAFLDSDAMAPVR